jgi:polyferredoxin
MARALPRRQAYRRVLLLASFLLFPITINYFSPYLIIDGVFAGIMTGSAIVFAAMLFGSMVFGRLWCGWACPIAGLTEPLLRVNGRRISRRADLVKWFIWVPWIALVIFAVVRAGGYHTVDPLYGTVGGISLAVDGDRPLIAAYGIYFGVVALFFGAAAVIGRRAGCHVMCWMAPFMILGRRVSNALKTPALRLETDPSRCTSCGTCTESCPMSVDVQSLVPSGTVEHPECSLCGTCADNCPRSVIRFSFRPPV